MCVVDRESKRIWNIAATKVWNRLIESRLEQVVYYPASQVVKYCPVDAVPASPSIVSMVPWRGEKGFGMPFEKNMLVELVALDCTQSHSRWGMPYRAGGGCTKGWEAFKKTFLQLCRTLQDIEDQCLLKALSRKDIQ